MNIMMSYISFCIGHRAWNYDTTTFQYILTNGSENKRDGDHILYILSSRIPAMREISSKIAHILIFGIWLFMHPMSIFNKSMSVWLPWAFCALHDGNSASVTEITQRLETKWISLIFYMHDTTKDDCSFKLFVCIYPMNSAIHMNLSIIHILWILHFYPKFLLETAQNWCFLFKLCFIMLSLCMFGIQIYTFSESWDLELYG